MTIFAYYFSPTTPGAAPWSVDVSGAIRLGSIQGVVTEAELGATGTGSVTLDDPLSTVGYLSDGIVGLKQFVINETDGPAGQRRLWTGYVGPRDYHRGQGDSLRTGTARKIAITLIDLNDFLHFRIFAPIATDPTSAFVRPAETDLQRITALLTVDLLSTTLYDISYIPTTGGVALDANDYTGRTPADVLNDCAQMSGRNFFVIYDEASGHYVLWYDVWTTDGATTKTYDSTISLTNVETEHNGTTVFAISEAVETLDPSRVISAVYIPYTGGTAYRKLATTADKFAWRDAVMPSSSVKTLTKANALGDRYLAENSTEDPRIKLTVRVPSTVVTLIRAGMRIKLHATHLPSVKAGYTWCRILALTVRQDQETNLWFWLDLDLSPLPSPCASSATPGGNYPPLGGPGSGGTSSANQTPADGVTQYWVPGEMQAAVAPNNAAGFGASGSGHYNQWHFPIWGAGGTGTEDQAGSDVSNEIFLYLFGAGIAVIHTTLHVAGATMTITQRSDEPTIQIALGTGLAVGTDQTVNIINDTRSSFPCWHFIEIKFDGPSGKVGYRGVDWTPT